MNDGSTQEKIIKSYNVLTALALSAVLLILMVLAVAAVLRQRSSARMVLQKQANLRRQEGFEVLTMDEIL